MIKSLMWLPHEHQNFTENEDVTTVDCMWESDLRAMSKAHCNDLRHDLIIPIPLDQARTLPQTRPLSPPTIPELQKDLSRRCLCASQSSMTSSTLQQTQWPTHSCRSRGPHILDLNLAGLDFSLCHLAHDRSIGRSINFSNMKLEWCLPQRDPRIKIKNSAVYENALKNTTQVNTYIQ